MVHKLLSRSQTLFNRQSNSILSAAAIIGLSFLGSAFLGLIRNRLLASTFFGGLEGDLDVYFAAFVIPDTLFQLLVVGAVSASFIPLYQEYSEQSDSKANRLANSALTFIGVIFILLSLVTAIFARPIAGLVSNFSATKLELMASLIRIMTFAQILFVFSSFFTGILQAHKRFLIPALAPILYNLGTIIGILALSDRFGIYSAAIGVVFGSLLHVVVQIPSLIFLGFIPRPLWGAEMAGVWEMIRLMPPRALALGLDQVERWVAVNLASSLVSGSLSIFTFARQLYVLPISLFGVSLSQATFPTLASDAVKADKSQFISTLTKSLMQIFFFALPASVLILVLRIPLVRLAFGARSFPWDATLETGRALAILSLSIAPQAATLTLTRALHALKDTKTSLYIGFYTMVFFVLISKGLGIIYGNNIFWICLALSLGNLLDFLLTYLAIRKKLGHFNIFTKILKTLGITLVMGFSLWIPMRLLDQFVFDTTRTIPLVILTLVVGLVGFGVYYSLGYLIGVEEIADVNQIIRKLGNWRKILASSDEVIDSTTPNN